MFVVVCFVLLLVVFCSCFLMLLFPGSEIREGQYWKHGEFGTDHDILVKTMGHVDYSQKRNDEQYKHQEVQQFKSAKSSNVSE